MRCRPSSETGVQNLDMGYGQNFENLVNNVIDKVETGQEYFTKKYKTAASYVDN